MAKVGRPTDYTEEACEVVVRLGAEGASRAEMAAELEIAIQTLHNWEAAHPEFLEATTRARDAAQAWWEKQGRLGIWSREFNASAYRLQVMNRFREAWTDSSDVNVHQTGTVQVEVTRKVVEVDPKNRIAPHTTNGASTNGSNGAGQP